MEVLSTLKQPVLEGSRLTTLQHPAHQLLIAQDPAHPRLIVQPKATKQRLTVQKFRTVKQWTWSAKKPFQVRPSTLQATVWPEQLHTISQAWAVHRFQIARQIHGIIGCPLTKVGQAANQYLIARNPVLAESRTWRNCQLSKQALVADQLQAVNRYQLATDQAWPAPVQIFRLQARTRCQQDRQHQDERI